jgi:uncharacterized protein (DUF305 family)
LARLHHRVVLGSAVVSKSMCQISNVRDYARGIFKEMHKQRSQMPTMPAHPTRHFSVRQPDKEEPRKTSRSTMSRLNRPKSACG